jgi:hypothetical protein
MITPKPKLRLDTTGQFLTMPLVGAHDNDKPVKDAVDRSVAQLTRICGN